MSVMINGIEIPKYKGEHKNFDRYGCFLTVYKNGKVELHVFENDYTIEEIPTPHGRLIDADKIYDPVEQRYRMSGGIEHRCERDLLDLICGTPTIIEEDGVNENS